MGRNDNRRDPLDRLVERREKAIFTAYEVLIEGTARNSRPCDHACDSRIARAHIRTNIGHGHEQSRTLDLAYALGFQPVRS